MNSKIAVLILLIVGVIAVAGLVLFYKSSTQGAATYQQVIHRNKDVYMPYYNVCARGPCGELAVQIGEIQSEESDVTRTAVCQCPDGKTFQIDYRKPY